MTATAVGPAPAYVRRERRPHRWLPVLAALGWLVLAALDASRLVAGLRTEEDAGLGHVHPGWPAYALTLAAMVAVMAPLVARNVRYVALRAPAAHRGAVVRWATGSWAAVWGLVLLPLGWLVAVGQGRLGAVGTALLAGVVAVAWQWSPWKRVGLARCDRVLAPPLRRREARVACCRFGTHLGWSCVTSCGPMMLLMLAGGHSVVVAAPLLAVAWHERRRRAHHDPARAATSWVIALAGVLAVAVVGPGWA